MTRWFLLLSLVAVSFHVCSARAAPPVIGDVPRFEGHDEREEAAETTEAVQAPHAEGEGPMCGPQLPIEPDPPTMFGLLTYEAITDEERTQVYKQIKLCARYVHTSADPWRVLAIYRFEEDLGVPKHLRGFLGAIVCWETAFKPNPRVGDVGRSFGPLQMMGWLWNWCGGDPTDDVFDAARCYWSRVEYKRNELGKRCKRPWVVAEALTANGPRYKHKGCAAESRHHEELARWKRNRSLISQ